MNNKLDKILAEISAGELLDKITILEIKKEKIINEEKLENIKKELASLNETMKKSIPDQSKIQYLKKDVFEIFDDDEYDSDDGEKNIDIATTDEYQGLQNDIILVSLVSTGKRPSPHLSNQKRLNVFNVINK